MKIDNFYKGLTEIFDILKNDEEIQDGLTENNSKSEVQVINNLIETIIKAAELEENNEYKIWPLS